MLQDKTWTDMNIRMYVCTMVASSAPSGRWCEGAYVHYFCGKLVLCGDGQGSLRNTKRENICGVVAYWETLDRMLPEGTMLVHYTVNTTYLKTCD